MSKKIKYPLIMEGLASGVVVKFTALEEGTVIKQGKSCWEIGHHSTTWTSHTNETMWKPYNPNPKNSAKKLKDKKQIKQRGKQLQKDNKTLLDEIEDLKKERDFYKELSEDTEILNSSLEIDIVLLKDTIKNSLTSKVSDLADYEKLKKEVKALNIEKVKNFLDIKQYKESLAVSIDSNSILLKLVENTQNKLKEEKLKHAGVVEYLEKKGA